MPVSRSWSGERSYADIAEDAAIAFGIHAPLQFKFKIAVLLTCYDVDHLALFDWPKCPPARSASRW
jgi:hypothetical protein